MGTDMTMAVERRRADGTWEHVPDAPQILGGARSYTLFCALAGVRQWTVWDRGENVPVMAQPRGLPADVSDAVRAECRMDGGYSETWHSVEALRAYPWEAIREPGVRLWLDAVALLGPPDAVRAVFWFD